MLLYGQKKYFISFFSVLIGLLCINPLLYAPPTPEQEKTKPQHQNRLSIPQVKLKAPTVKTLLRRGLVGYLTKKYDLRNKLFYEIDLQEHLPPEFRAENMKTLQISQRKALDLALFALTLKFGVLASPVVTFAVAGGYGLAGTMLGSWLNKRFAPLSERIAQHSWFRRYPEQAAVFMTKLSINSAIYSRILQAAKILTGSKNKK